MCDFWTLSYGYPTGMLRLSYGPSIIFVFIVGGKDGAKVVKKNEK